MLGNVKFCPKRAQRILCVLGLRIGKGILHKKRIFFAKILRNCVVMSKQSLVGTSLWALRHEEYAWIDQHNQAQI
jgi:hypothetical protein